MKKTHKSAKRRKHSSTNFGSFDPKAKQAPPLTLSERVTVYDLEMASGEKVQVHFSPAKVARSVDRNCATLQEFFPDKDIKNMSNEEYTRLNTLLAQFFQRLEQDKMLLTQPVN